MRGRWSLERTGTAVLVVLALLTVAIVGISAVLRIGADDLFALLAQARAAGRGEVPARTVYGAWVSGPLSLGVAPGDLDALNTRAQELSYKSDRLRELAAVPAVIGLLSALLTDAPSPSASTRREANQPEANATSNGIV